MGGCQILSAALILTHSTKLHTFNGVPEALRGSGVVRWSVKGVKLQTVQNILGHWQPLHHGPSHIARWVPSDGTGLCAWRKGQKPGSEIILFTSSDL